MQTWSASLTVKWAIIIIVASLGYWEWGGCGLNKTTGVKWSAQCLDQRRHCECWFPSQSVTSDSASQRQVVLTSLGSLSMSSSAALFGGPFHHKPATVLPLGSVYLFTPFCCLWPSGPELPRTQLQCYFS